jgi:hypothetical protein
MAKYLWYSDTPPREYRNQIDQMRSGEIVISKRTTLFEVFPILLERFHVYKRDDGNFGVDDEHFVRFINAHIHEFSLGHNDFKCSCFKKFK